MGVGVGVPVGPGVGVEVGVGVGVDVGPGVEVGVGVPVIPGVGVGVGSAAIANVNVQAGTAALGVTWGTVGATGVVCCNFCTVRKITAPRPRVINVAMLISHPFFISFIATAHWARTLLPQW